MKRTPLVRKTPLKRTRLKPVSKKQSKAMVLYAKLRTQFLSENRTCQAECSNRATQVHHKYGRGPNLNRTETWMAVCAADHEYIHAHPNQARERGWLK